MGNCDPYSDSPEPWSSTRVYSGSRSRYCYAIKCRTRTLSFVLLQIGYPAGYHPQAWADDPSGVWNWLFDKNPEKVTNKA
jgi:hypothetical protein